jgi:hypothetical protein
MSRQPVESTVRHDRTAAFTDVGGRPATPEPRFVNLFIEEDNDGAFSIRVQSQSDHFPPEENWRARLPLDRDALWGAVRECQNAWRTIAVDHVEKGQFLLQRAWDLSKRRDLCTKLLGELAVAGTILFDALFTPAEDGTKDAERLARIARALRELTDAEPGWIRVTSDRYFAPWNLLYSKRLEDRLHGSDVDPDGFWGFRHLVEHSPLDEVRPGTSIVTDRPIRMSAYLDDSIDKRLGVPCNAPLKDALAAYDEAALSLEYRNDIVRLEEGWRELPLLAQILYFCCEAQAEQDGDDLPFKASSLTLTDRAAITAGHLALILKDKDFQQQPIVFLNACETARMNSVFYEGFAKTFLGKRASSVIGTTTEIPAVFAGEFAKRFFTELFEGDGDSERRRVGDILLRLRRAFLEQNANPLGLLYALYHGADVSLPALATRAGGGAEVEARPPAS